MPGEYCRRGGRFLDREVGHFSCRRQGIPRQASASGNQYEPKNYFVWVNCVRLAGAFKLKEAIPALVQAINAATVEGQTLAETARLDTFPCAKALVEIGDPAVPSLVELMEKGDWRRRWFACRVLLLIGSPRSIDALRDHIDRESDQHLKQQIQKALSTR
jgi:HEAT repeat protein